MEYYNLTGDLIQLNQNIPFTINGSLEMVDIITNNNITLYNDKCIFNKGIIFPELVDELSLYFSKWTITLKLSSSIIGEIWENCPIVSIQKNSNNIFEIYSDNDVHNTDGSGDFEIHNYLYKGVNPTLDKNLELKKYLTYKLWYEGGKPHVFQYSDTLEISHTFTREEFPSGDLILRTLYGTLYNAFIADFTISTTESYTGRNYRIKVYPGSGGGGYGPDGSYKLINTLNYKIDPIYYPGPDGSYKLINTLNYKINSIDYPGSGGGGYGPDGSYKLINTLNYKINPIYYPGPKSNKSLSLLNLKYKIKYNDYPSSNKSKKLITFNYKINSIDYPEPGGGGYGPDGSYKLINTLNYKINKSYYPGPKSSKSLSLLNLKYKIGYNDYPSSNKSKKLITFNYKINSIDYPGSSGGGYGPDGSYKLINTLNYKINTSYYPGPKSSKLLSLLNLKYKIGYNDYPSSNKSKKLITFNYKINLIDYPGSSGSGYGPDGSYKLINTLRYKTIHSYPSNNKSKEIFYLHYEVQEGFIFPPSTQSDILVFSYPEPEKQDDLLIIKLFDELILSYPDPEKLDDILSADKDIDTILDYQLMIAYPDPDVIVNDDLEIYLHNIDVKDLNELQRIFAYPYPIKLYDILHLNMDNDIEVYYKR